MIPLLKIVLLFVVSFRISNALESKRSLEELSSTFIVSMLNGTEPVLRSFSTKSYQSHGERVGTLAKQLEDHARISQEPVKKYLETVKDPHFQVHSLWLQNALILKKAPADVILHLKTHFSHLLSVQSDSFFLLDDPPSSSPPFVLSSADVQRLWGIKRIQAEEAVKLLQSSLSTSLPQIHVATIDTGVRLTHKALRDNYLGTYGWFDPETLTKEPFDNIGHGTHVTGTICGREGIGVFPHATWMACLGCPTAMCSTSAFLECAQFMTCPTLPDRSSPNCSMAPHIVSNSWNTRNDPFFYSSIDAWRSVGIVPVFSFGNSGDKCNTGVDPANSPNVISVGSTRSNDSISGFSSRGPTSDGRIKPDFVAPGSDVISASDESDDKYESKSGTSMACPHVAGLVALLLAYDQSLGFEKIVDALKAGVQTSPLNPPEGFKCGDIPSDTFPNNIFGHGLVNALSSLKYVIEKRQ